MSIALQGLLLIALLSLRLEFFKPKLSGRGITSFDLQTELLEKLAYE